MRIQNYQSKKDCIYSFYKILDWYIRLLDARRQLILEIAAFFFLHRKNLRNKNVVNLACTLEYGRLVLSRPSFQKQNRKLFLRVIQTFTPPALQEGLPKLLKTSRTLLLNQETSFHIFSLMSKIVQVNLLRPFGYVL